MVLSTVDEKVDEKVDERKEGFEYEKVVQGKQGVRGESRDVMYLG